MIAIVNYGVGNLDSVLRAFRKCEADAVIATDRAQIDAADHVVLPGVGSFAKAMHFLQESGLLPVMERKILEEKTPLLGICLGFQMLTRHSEEGDARGLGWIDGETRRFRFDDRLPQPKVPHMGWNELERRKSSPLLDGIAPKACFYFAHSYCVHCSDENAVLATSEYGYEFVSAIHKDNLFGTQFHPEKSHASGLRLLRNFIGFGGDA